MTTSKPTDDRRGGRSWFVPDEVAAHNHHLGQFFEHVPHMNLQRWKVAKIVLVDAAIAALVGFAIANGAPPLESLLIGVPAMLLVAGVERAELAAVVPWMHQPPQHPVEDDTD
jgi:hypothetical protein